MRRCRSSGKFGNASESAPDRVGRRGYSSESQRSESVAPSGTGVRRSSCSPLFGFVRSKRRPATDLPTVLTRVASSQGPRAPPRPRHGFDTNSDDAPPDGEPTTGGPGRGYCRGRGGTPGYRHAERPVMRSVRTDGAGTLTKRAMKGAPTAWNLPGFAGGRSATRTSPCRSAVDACRYRLGFPPRHLGRVLLARHSSGHSQLIRLPCRRPGHLAQV
jgi:hypothetical protein